MVQKSVLSVDSDSDEIVEISVIKKVESIESIENNDILKDIHSYEAIKPDEEELEYGANASEIASDRMAANLADNYIQKDPDEGISEEEKEDKEKEGEEEEEEEEEKEDKEEKEEEEEEDYEILTYRKKEYWIIKGADPQYVYEVLDDDALGDKIGIYGKGVTGKMKVVLDKK